MAESIKENLIISNKTLTQFFYENLSLLNKKSICPLPEEFILYSSEALEKYAISDAFFDVSSGKANEKVLGIELLKAVALEESEKRKVYRDIGDTSLVKLGLFTRSCETKLLTRDYYTQIGKTAYTKLANLNCEFYEIPSFYKKFSTSFEHIIKLLASFSAYAKEESFEKYLLNNSGQELFSFSNKESNKAS